MPDAGSARPMLLLSENAAKRVGDLMAREEAEGMMLRVAVSGGGCSGFQYGFSFDDAVADDDVVFEYHGVRMVVDEISLELLDGAEVDYVEDLAGAAFSIRNPNATASCGCGNSFAV